MEEVLVGIGGGNGGGVRSEMGMGEEWGRNGGGKRGGKGEAWGGVGEAGRPVH